MRLPVNRSLPLIALVLLSACGGGSPKSIAPPPPANGPAADYPMVLGQPFTVEGVTYTPADTWNYDTVGRAAFGGEGGSAITGAHRTLPLPSYVEVTSIETGKTILVRLERRGPMTAGGLVELSPGAAAQLGIAGRSDAPIRLRRVNPPEADRAPLRMGQPAPARLDTPKSLLTVLQRKLDLQEGRPAAAPVTPEPQPAPQPVAAPAPKPEPKPAKGKPKAAPKPQPARAATTPPVAVAPVPKADAKAAPKPASAGGLVVQIGAYSSEERAKAAAARTGGQVQPVGKLWRVRSGPFPDRAAADAALAKVRAAGYTDARIQRGG
ncbi:MAG: hypothetical protein RL702_958 [Pseudomonadota bacterium]|jgi:rare lipoprotein A